MIRSVFRWTHPGWAALWLGLAVALQSVVTAEAASTPARSMVKVTDPAKTAEILAAGGRFVENYGSYHLVEIDSAAALDLGEGAEVLSGAHLIRLNNGAIDTSLPPVAPRAVQSNGAGKKLFLVQFVGPIKSAWAEQIRNAGAEIISYIPENTYLVYGDQSAFGAVQSAATQPTSRIRWQGDFLPAHKLQSMPMARTASGVSVPATEYYVVQMVDDEAANGATLQMIDQLKNGEARQDTRLLRYRNITVPLSMAAAEVLASRPEVVSVTPFIVPKKMGERQSLIVSGNITEPPVVQPSSTTNYIAWLEAKGFPVGVPFEFAVDVTDSGIDNGTTSPGHFGLYVAGDFALGSRVVYNRLFGFANTNSTLEGCDGHGTIDAHIIGGYGGPVITLVTNETDTNIVTMVTNRVGFPYQDGQGYFYGLGVAPSVLLGSSVIFDPYDFTFPEYSSLISAAYANGARISANSWGSDVGGRYVPDSQQYDALVRDARPGAGQAGNQEMVIVFAAGNAGPNDGTVGSPATAKNVITVGASEGVQEFGGPDNSGIGDSEADNADDVIFFASRGPTTDGRQKPDLMAPGTHISGGVAQVTDSEAENGEALECFDGTGVSGGLATNIFFPEGQEFYTASSGTSQATPAVAGAAALLRQHFLNLGSNAPSAAMTKGFLMNSARYMTGENAGDTLWSPNQGMGMVNLTTAFDDAVRIIKDQNEDDLLTESGQERLFTGYISDTNRAFRVTLAWTDAPGSTVADAYNNNLNLRVYVNGVLYHGNNFEGQFSIPGGTADDRNNVESVFLPAGTVGEVAIFVDADNINSDGVPGNESDIDQDFALIAYNMVEAPIAVVVPSSATFISEEGRFMNDFIDAGETLTFDFAFRNVGLLDTENLVATLLETNGVSPVTTDAVYGVLSTNRTPVTNRFTFVVDPDVECGAIIEVTFALTDGEFNKGTVSFPMIVGLPLTNTLSFSNPQKIALINYAPAVPFPSGLVVSDVVGDDEIGSVIGVSVTLSNFFHTFPQNAVVILANARREGVVLMQGAGGFGAVSTNTYTLTFADNANTTLTELRNGTFRPNGANGFDGEIPPNVPRELLPTRYLPRLNDLAASDPNGEWHLLAFCNLGATNIFLGPGFPIFIGIGNPSGSGYIQDGWSLRLTERRLYCDTTVADVEVTQTSTPDRVLPNDTITYSLLVTNKGPNTAQVVNLEQTVSPSLSIGKVAVSQGTFTIEGNVIRFALGSLEVGEFATITIATKVEQPVDIVTTAAATLPLDLDSYPENNVVTSETSRGRLLSSGNAITIPALGPATPYPATLSVSGVTGVVNKVVVRLNELTHAYPRDLDILLVGPRGQRVMLMSDAGPASSVNWLELAFDDSGPAVPQAQLTNGTYRPTNYEAETTPLPTSAPALPYGDSLAAFNGQDPNGTWSLYVYDDTRENVGVISGGWSVELFLGNNFTNDLSITHSMPGTVFRNVPFEIATTVSNNGPTNATSVFVTNTLPQAAAASSVTVSAGSHVIVGDNVIWQVGPLARNASATMRVEAVVPTLGSITSRSEVRTQDNDPVAANNVGVRTANVVLPPGVTENPLAIQIPISGPANLYPSSIEVSGHTSPVTRVTVTLLGFSHSFPKDVDVLLVGPEGQKVLLMSDAGGGIPASGLNLTFSDRADTDVPRGALSSGTFRPADWDVTLDLPAPAPAQPYAGVLSAFSGTDANGTWSLYVSDHDGFGDSGSISGGWILNISTEVEPPVLSIRREDDDVILSWPAEAVGFQLQGAPELTDEPAWTDLTSPAPAVIGGENVQTQSITNGMMFFRLIQ